MSDTSRAEDIIRTAYYILGPWCDKINFCCFICVTQWWTLHVVINGGFLHLYLPFFTIAIHSWAEILLLSHLKNKRAPYGNSTSGFDFKCFIVIGVWFCTEVTNFVLIGRSLRELWRYVDFPRWQPYAGHTIANLLSLSGFMKSHI